MVFLEQSTVRDNLLCRIASHDPAILYYNAPPTDIEDKVEVVRRDDLCMLEIIDQVYEVFSCTRGSRLDAGLSMTRI